MFVNTARRAAVVGSGPEPIDLISLVCVTTPNITVENVGEYSSFYSRCAQSIGIDFHLDTAV